MGLDMSVYKYKKKMDKETFDKFIKGRNIDIDHANEFIRDYKELSREDFYNKHLSRWALQKINNEPMPEYEFLKDNESNDSNYHDYLLWFNSKKSEAVNAINKDIIHKIETYEKGIAIREELSDLFKDVGNNEEIAYWRKHSDLNGYMEELYREKGGDDEFNCVPLYLSKEDVEQIVDDHRRHLNEDDEFTIGEASGFFWGATEHHDWKGSLEDFERILEETDWDNETVYYSCWW